MIVISNSELEERECTGLALVVSASKLAIAVTETHKRKEFIRENGSNSFQRRALRRVLVWSGKQGWKIRRQTTSALNRSGLGSSSAALCARIGARLVDFAQENKIDIRNLLLRINPFGTV
jgi:hypothetical protein